MAALKKGEEESTILTVEGLSCCQATRKLIRAVHCDIPQFGALQLFFRGVAVGLTEICSTTVNDSEAGEAFALSAVACTAAVIILDR